MAIAPAANVVVAPPEPPRHTLLESVPHVEEDTDRWEAGFNFWREACVEPGAWAPCVQGSGRQKDLSGGTPKEVWYDPFVAYVPFTCTAAGFPREDFQGRLKEMAEAGWTKAIEREFWSGTLIDTNPHILSGDGTPDGPDYLSAAPVGAEAALVLLTQGLADCGSGSLGVLHAPPAVVELWMKGGLIHEDENGVLRTGARGDIVVAGSGYSHENGYAAYATGLIEVRLGSPTYVPDTFAEAFDRATNTVTYLLERTAAVTHTGCCVLGVKIGSEPSGVPVG